MSYEIYIKQRQWMPVKIQEMLNKVKDDAEQLSEIRLTLIGALASVEKYQYETWKKLHTNEIN